MRVAISELADGINLEMVIKDLTIELLTLTIGMGL